MYTRARAANSRIGVCSYRIFRAKGFATQADNREKCKPMPGAFNIFIAGSAGHIGSKLAMLLKSSQVIDSLSLLDVDENICSIAQDLRQIKTQCRVYDYTSTEHLKDALTGCQIVVICGSDSCKGNITPDTMFERNAPIVEEIAVASATYAPKAIVLVASQPLDSLTPLVCQVYRDHNLKSNKLVMGVTGGDTVRASRIFASNLHCSAEDIIVPVIGGHDPETLVPLYSGTTPLAKSNSTVEELDLCNRMLAAYKSSIPDAETQSVIANMVYVVKHWDKLDVNSNFVNDPSISMTESMAIYTTISGLIKAKCTKAYISHMAFVETNVIPGLEFSSMPILMGSEGVSRVYPVPALTDAERALLGRAMKKLDLSVGKGRQYAIQCLVKRCVGIPFRF